MEYKINIRENVKKLCKIKGITQKEVATRMGISDNSLNITLSKANPKLSTLEAMATALDVPVIDLLRDAESVGEDYHTPPRVEYVPYMRCPHCGGEIEMFVRPVSLDKKADR